MKSGNPQIGKYLPGGGEQCGSESKEESRQEGEEEGMRREEENLDTSCKSEGAEHDRLLQKISSMSERRRGHFSEGWSRWRVSCVRAWCWEQISAGEVERLMHLVNMGDAIG